MLLKFLVKLLALFIPSKNLRHKLRNWPGLVTQQDRIEREVGYIKRLLQFSFPARNIPPAQGLMRGIQLLMVEKMQMLADLFAQNNIHYWLDFGSLLGAVRHKGGVPWDEDLDIAIDMQDRDAVIRLFREKGIEYTTFHGEHSLLRIPILKVKGYVAHIDIMSYVNVKGISDAGIEQAEAIMKKANKKFACYADAYHLYVMERLSKLPSILPGDKSVYVRCVDCRLVYPSYVVDESTLYPLTAMPFEDTVFSVPCKVAEYLTCLYKDFMQWPPALFSNDVVSRMPTDSRLQLIEILRASECVSSSREDIGL